MSASRVTEGAARRHTLVAFHAHPDDEALFTGGTLARAAAAGHRTVVVTATLGEQGLSATAGPGLDRLRAAELEAACSALGVARLVTLGYGDSGMAGPLPPGALCAVPAEEVAQRLLEVLVEEHADVLTGYDPNGGYGHRDHIRVHEIARLAARSLPEVGLYEATVPREPLVRGVGLLNRLGIAPGGMTRGRLAGSYTPASQITHRVDVSPVLPRKLAALRAHASQASGGSDLRTLRLLTQPLVARLVLRREWFVHVVTPATPGRKPPSTDLSDMTG